MIIAACASDKVPRIPSAAFARSGQPGERSAAAPREGAIIMNHDNCIVGLVFVDVWHQLAISMDWVVVCREVQWRGNDVKYFGWHCVATGTQT